MYKQLFKKSLMFHLNKYLRTHFFHIDQIRQANMKLYFLNAIKRINIRKNPVHKIFSSLHCNNSVYLCFFSEA